MNSTDFHDCMVRNREIYAREQAKLDHIYEQERAKYTPTSTSNFKATPIQVPQANNNYSDIVARLDKIESRIDKLYEMFGCRQQYSSDGMFIIAPSNANISANQSITLSDSQFNELMNRLIGD
jgi:hypothetical protein